MLLMTVGHFYFFFIGKKSLACDPLHPFHRLAPRARAAPAALGVPIALQFAVLL